MFIGIIGIVVDAVKSNIFEQKTLITYDFPESGKGLHYILLQRVVLIRNIGLYYGIFIIICCVLVYMPLLCRKMKMNSFYTGCSNVSLGILYFI